jgi:hypothetical protein
VRVVRAIAVVALAALVFAVGIELAPAEGPAVVAPAQQATYQGKTVKWWAKHTVQARKDANARAVTIKRLKRTIAYDPSIQEAVSLASIAYPALSQHRAWCIIKHESWMVRDPTHARNPRSSATGLYQFLTSTFRSTPYSRFSIYSPYAQSLAAGWMHESGRGGEWAIRC